MVELSKVIVEIPRGPVAAHATGVAAAGTAGSVVITPSVLDTLYFLGTSLRDWGIIVALLYCVLLILNLLDILPFILKSIKRGANALCSFAQKAYRRLRLW